MRTLIAIPCFDKLDTAFAKCLFALKRTGKDGITFHPSSLIYDARNKLGQMAAESGAEYILWLDSDMVFEPDALEKLFESIKGRDFVTGLYFNRRPPYMPTIFKEAGFKQGEGREVIPVAEIYEDYPKDEIFEIAACGFGCVLMRAEMFTKIFDTQGLPFSPILGFGEDISFCLRAKQAGYKLYCDPRIHFGHLTQTTVTEELSEAWRAVKCSKK